MQKLFTIALLLGSLASCASSIPIEVIEPSVSEVEEVPVEQPVAVASYPHMTMTSTGQRNRFGNPIYRVSMYGNGGQLIGTVNAVSGRASTQGLDRNVPNREAPLPNGKYSVSTQVVPGTEPEVGGLFLPITPLFSTGRTALGFHVDPSYNRDAREDGTAGCVGTTTKQERDFLFSYVRNHHPHYFLVGN